MRISDQEKIRINKLTSEHNRVAPQARQEFTIAATEGMLLMRKTFVVEETKLENNSRNESDDTKKRKFEGNIAKDNEQTKKIVRCEENTSISDNRKTDGYFPSDIGRLIGSFLSRWEGGNVAATCKEANTVASQARESFFRANNVKFCVYTDQDVSYMPLNLFIL